MELFPLNIKDGPGSRLPIRNKSALLDWSLNEEPSSFIKFEQRDGGCVSLG